MPNVRRAGLPILLFLLLVTLFGASPLAAVNYLGDRGGDCFTLTAGGTVTLSFSGGTGQKSCAILSNWSGLVAPSSGDRMNGASGNSAAPTVATNGSTTQTNEVLIATFGFVAPTQRRPNPRSTSAPGRGACR